jgi:NAD(P)-dependent dehydrogenase (short-subunit alcohol dehydrogenase family)
MTQSERDTQTSVQDVALIVGGGPGISSSCARLFAEAGMRVCVAARNPEKAVLETLEETHGVRRYACDASEPAAVEQLFENVVRDIGTPRLVVHNIDGRVPGIFRKSVIEADPGMVLETLRSAAFSAFLVGRQAARLMLGNELEPTARKERSSSRTPAQRSKASHQAVPLQWHVMPSPDSRRAWQEN